MTAEGLARTPPRIVCVRAFAKINLSLRVLGLRPDGYHELRTVFQSIALHDTLTFQQASGAFRISCNDTACPTDATNLVWQAALRVWAAAGRRGAPGGVAVRIAKRIPVRAGLGGGSSDAAAAIRALAALWRVDLSDDRMREIASSIGADVPYFLQGGTVLGVGRGDELFPLVDAPGAWVTVVVPAFGIGTGDAYDWWDGGRAERLPRATRARRRPAAAGPRKQARIEGGAARLIRLVGEDLRNDLEGPVVGRYPELGRMLRVLGRGGAFNAALSGSGSAVFGLFERQDHARACARRLVGRGRRVVVTRTLNRNRYRTLTRLAGKTAHRIHFSFAPRGSGHS